MKSNPDVTLFLPSLAGGGAERIMLNLAQGLIERGLNTNLVVAAAAGPYLRQVPPTIEIVDLGASRVAFSLPRLVKFLRDVQPKALLSAMDHANVVAVAAQLIAGVRTRTVVTVHNTISKEAENSAKFSGRLLPLLLKPAYMRASAIVAVSRGVASDLARVAGIPASRVSVIYNPVVSPAMFELANEPVSWPWPIEDGVKIVMAAGRLTVQKDFGTLIRAFRIVRHARPCKLVILGEGEERRTLELLATRLGLWNDVFLPGFVENPYKFIAKANVFVLSSLWEGLPTALIEAMALGVPVVSTNCPSGPAEILEDGKWGQLVPPADPEALAEATLMTLSCPLANPRLRGLQFSRDTAVAHYASLLAA